MSELYQSLSHSKWDCKYHVILLPKQRRKLIFGQARRQLGGFYCEVWQKGGRAPWSCVQVREAKR